MDGQEQAFERHGAQQDRTVRGHEARRGDLAAVDGQTHFGDGPCGSLAPGDDDGLRSPGDEFETVGQRGRDDEKRRAGVDQQLDVFHPAGRPGQAPSHAKLLYGQSSVGTTSARARSASSAGNGTGRRASWSRWTPAW